MIGPILFLLCLNLLSVRVTAQEIDLEDQLILLLPFNGSALDESGHDVSTQVEGPVLTNDRYGNPNSAYLFDGTNDYINLNNNSPLITSKSFTICMWVKINGQSLDDYGGNSFFEQRDDDSFPQSARSTIYFRGEFNGNVLLHMRSNVLDEIEHLQCDYVVNNGWHHYVARVDELKKMEIYIDANLHCSGIFPNDGNFITSVDHVNLGSHHWAGEIQGALNGVMDEVYIYNRALNLCEIEALYSGQLLEER
ncbi:MAG: LamG domain-containing protein [Bacteroidales bacterium]|nr:LamG domain-containing protein [Bacteroidales bacterium]